ncbi:MAG: hypothetical protein O3C28_11360 [Proteobacteria bacterium]|jgi:L-lysine 2,3-aminomutase|nr:hypothetical protein [Pseudomonadota bacterium]
MAKYHEHFRLSPSDLELIEQAVRTEIAIHTRVQRDAREFDEARKKARALNDVLGKLHNQKIFYAQVNDTGVPVA